MRYVVFLLLCITLSIPVQAQFGGIKVPKTSDVKRAVEKELKEEKKEEPKEEKSTEKKETPKTEKSVEKKESTTPSEMSDEPPT
ncbi:MAG: hypothetical protein JNJ85_12940, partial [Candidatus Kapabacteria bacterium]|nr:hypothetical protein [Candidatus Kapabacteria bacterium]